MSKHIHIVCPEVPLPSSAADMADTYFQLHYLHEAGYKIHLHCFYHDTYINLDHLKAVTIKIELYARNEGHKGISMRHPYCVSSRANPNLLANLLLVKYPVLFQGMTSTYYLPELAARGYKTYVRINGIKSALYDTTMKCEKSLLRKVYSYNEARLIRKWEARIARKATIFTTTLTDQQRFLELYPGAQVKYIAPLLPAPEVDALQGTGMYCLYYGDMSNAENEKTAHWLSEIFSRMPVPLIVADTSPSQKERDPSHPESNICMVSNPDEAALKELIQKAQVILLPRCHNSGFDKRLLAALATGRHCICNDLMIKNTAFEKLFIVANGCDEVTQAIEQYFSRPFTHYDVNERTHLLSTGCCMRQSMHDLLTAIG